MNKCLAVVLLFCCSLVQVVADTPFMTRVNADFQRKKEALPNGSLFEIFNQHLTPEEKDALTFFYAYMPIGDITDYPGAFYLENIRSSLRTRNETAWGHIIPEDIFRHFVLPIRVNNENLDNARIVFHDEIMPRLKGLSMYDAVLEVNHWCHEKVSYQPADSRTSAPLATVKTAYGRCGEESTFLVAALRSVGIPARQVYTPRWAHTDDNHAWVEAWVDDKWYFLGACEPEPVLNLGWFNAPASRGMLMHTKVFGYYEGPEEVMRTTSNYTEINIISNYAASAPLTVVAVDKNDKPIKGATVQFKIFNYAELFTVSSQITGADGKAKLSAGLGDMVVFVQEGNRFGFSRVSFGKEKEVRIPASHWLGEEFASSFDLIPPPEKAVIPNVTPEQRAINDRRFNTEDSIRHAYIETFPDTKDIIAFAKKYNYRMEEINEYITASRGNYKEIFGFLKKAATKRYQKRALALLATLSAKDLRDTPQGILDDHLYNTPLNASASLVMAPRIATEMLTPFRSFFQREVSKADANRFRKDPGTLVSWCLNNLKLRPDLCTIETTISPAGVWRSRVCDKRSRDIFFVALARSLNIPARMDPVTGKILYKKNGKEIIANFESGKAETIQNGSLQLTYSPIPRLNDPEYYRHFTLATFGKAGASSLGYPEFKKWSSLFKHPSPIAPGYYMMTSGSRMANGGVLVRLSFFSIYKGVDRTEQLIMRDNAEEVAVIGNFDSESRYTEAKTQKETSILQSAGRGYFCIAVLGVGEEPTDHALKDIALKAKDFEAWGRKMIFLFPNMEDYNKYMKAPAKGLPSNIEFGIDNENKIRNSILKEMKLLPNTQMPLLLIGDTFNRVVFESHGYTIGLGDQMLHIIHGLK